MNGKQNSDAAWYYPEPTDAAAQIKDHVAFWRGVEISQSASPGSTAVVAFRPVVRLAG